MKTTRIKSIQNLGILLLALVSFVFTACNDKEMVNKSYPVAFEATDAPIDNAEVQAVFVTVSEIWVDGKKVEGFNKTTLELSALTNGKTQLLKEANLDVSSINEVSFVLDYEMDASGISPGTYIQKANGTKDKLSSMSTKIDIQKRIDLAANATTTLVADFDLRQMIKESSGDYELVTEAELEAAVRVVAKSGTGSIKGSIEHADSMKRKSIAFLYKKGEFDAVTEVSGSGESKIQFANAITSASVNSQGEFVLSFVEEGEYEIHVFEFDDKNNDGKLEVTGKATLMSKNSIQLDGFDVSANSTTELDVSLISFITL